MNKGQNNEKVAAALHALGLVDALILDSIQGHAK